MKLLKYLVLISFFAIGVCHASTKVTINNLDFQEEVKGYGILGTVCPIEKREAGAGDMPPAMTVYKFYDVKARSVMKPQQIPSAKGSVITSIDSDAISAKGFCFTLGVINDGTGQTPCDLGAFQLEGRKIKEVTIDIRGGYFQHPYFSNGTTGYKCVLSDVQYVQE